MQWVLAGCICVIWIFGDARMLNTELATLRSSDEGKSCFLPLAILSQMLLRHDDDDI